MTAPVATPRPLRRHGGDGVSLSLVPAHDGLGATLAGVRLQVESARRLVEQPTAQGLLDRTGNGVAQAVLEVRHIVEGLRPPGVDDLGLGRAIDLAADRVRAPGLDVEVEIGPVPDVGPAAEAAAYRIVTEALANVVKHSGAHHVLVRLTAKPHGLAVTVEDDGTGIRADAVGGVGLTSMRRRAEELGGRLTLTTSEGGRGTTVDAMLPSRRCPHDAAARRRPPALPRRGACAPGR